MQSSALNEILERLDTMDPLELERVRKDAEAATSDMFWIPNPGPQTAAYYCEAEQLLYGGEAGGGKSDVILGLARQEHQRSLLMRRLGADVDWLVDRMEEICDNRDGFNGQSSRWKFPDGRVVDFKGCPNLGDEKRTKGRPKDFIGFDEATDFLEEMIVFIIGWLRTTEPNQRCRIVFATNPPTDAEGEWVIRWFAPWVDPSHPLYPYPPGKLLWCYRNEDDDSWCWIENREDAPEGVDPISRTFIPSGLSDNPDLQRTDYGRQLNMLPEHLRRRYRDGDFTAADDDDEMQIIPTAWIREAQERWTPDGNRGRFMTTMGCDVAQGGKDNTILTPSYDDIWLAEQIIYKGIETRDGPDVASRVIKHLLDNAQVNIDMGGGWGGSAHDHLKQIPGMSVMPIVPSAGTDATTRDGNHGFLNVRAEIHWYMRERLDPGNPDNRGRELALPPSPLLRADLSAPRFKLISGGRYQVESKTEIKKRIGRSPDYGDSAILAVCTGKFRVVGHRLAAASGKTTVRTTPSKSRTGTRPRVRVSGGRRRR